MRHLHRLALVPLLACLVALGAGPATARPASEQQAIDGDWVEDSQTPDSPVQMSGGESFMLPARIPGYGSTLQLHTHGSTVTGSGSYRMEAGRAGTLTVSGTYHAPNLSLKIIRDYGQVASFQARVVDATHIHGVMAYENHDTSETSFVRK